MTWEYIYHEKMGDWPHRVATEFVGPDHFYEHIIPVHKWCERTFKMGDYIVSRGGAVIHFKERANAEMFILKWT